MNRYLKENELNFFVRYNGAISIVQKIRDYAKPFTSFSSLVSSTNPFGLSTNFAKFESKKVKGSLKLFHKKGIGYVNPLYIQKNKDWISRHKILIPKAIGTGDNFKDRFKTKYAGPESCCTTTYTVIHCCNSKAEIDNIDSYINTKFFHFLVTLFKNTQDSTKKIFQLVPVQDFKQQWDDSKLYSKYDLNQQEIDFIEKMIPHI